MRLWSLHPRYLDSRGLVAQWREGLLAQRMLSGAANGYRHHPQLLRFHAQPDPSGAIAAYLREVQREAVRRGYHFDESKIGRCASGMRMTVTRGQLAYELAHLRAKLATRDPAALQRIADVVEPEPHPLFEVVPGEVEAWERVR
ncbi:MAG TPA: pyrimidine dimer DNA glycosylase/endonuclease V [Gallionella sp.]|nr:pyrimidine dimer DNA glycosylase/endonuclease V [Gallionella sp.]